MGYLASPTSKYGGLGFVARRKLDFANTSGFSVLVVGFRVSWYVEEGISLFYQWIFPIALPPQG